MSEREWSDAEASGRQGAEVGPMNAVKALARVLRKYDGDPDEWQTPTFALQAQTILADPGPLLAALAEAGVLAPFVAAREAQAAAKALREAAEECDSTGHHWSGRPALAFFAVATDLRKRADRIERGES